METSIESVGNALRSLGAAYLQIQEYRMTHGYLHLLLTDRDFTRLADLYLSDCYFISGPTSGGPYRLMLEQRHDDGQEAVFVSTEPAAFMAKALKVAFETSLR